MKSKIILLLFLLSVLSVNSQNACSEPVMDETQSAPPPSENRGSKQNNFDETRKELENKKVEYITKKLSLTADESEKFWPIYNDFHTKKHEIICRERSILKTVMIQKTKSENKYPKPEFDIEKLSNQDATEIIDNRMKLCDLEKKYQANLQKILPSQKIVELYILEDGFKLMLLNELKKGAYDKNKDRDHIKDEKPKKQD